MPVRCVLALDQGTTSSRAIVFDAAGRPLALAQREFTQHFPQPGWVEHDPEEIWQTQSDVAIEALQRAGMKAAEVAALAITNQRETTVLWDRATGTPLHRAIVWQDRRTASLCQQMKTAGHEASFRHATGLVLDPYFSGSKLAWLLDAIPGARARAEAGELCFGTIDSWLAWKLSGGALHVTDASNASRTLLFNLHSGRWDTALCETLGIPLALLPQVCDSSAVLGQVTTIPALAGIPLASLVGDQQGALAGQACFAPGLAKNTYGTGCFLLMHTGRTPTASHRGLLTTVASRLDGQLHYALEGSVFMGGATVQWLRDGLGLVKQASDIEALASTVTDTGDVVFVPAFAGLGAPHWDAEARGLLVGLTRGTTGAHIARAALEAIAFQVADLVDAIEADGQPLAELRVDGGAAANNLLLQLQADILQKPVVRPTITETTALGAAYLAGLATGFWSGLDEIASHWQVDRCFLPQASEGDIASRRARWQDAVQRAQHWART